MDRLRIGVLGAVIGVLAGGAPLEAGFSNDESPTEIAVDPGDVFLNGLGLEIDDFCGLIGPPWPSPCFGVPLPNAGGPPWNFDLDGYTLDRDTPVCPAAVPFVPGILFSLDDADPGAGTHWPDEATELFFYDVCGRFVPAPQTPAGSYRTNQTELVLGLGNNPPGLFRDDDVDAYELRQPLLWQGGERILFTPDTPSAGGLPGSACNPGAEGHIFSHAMNGALVQYASPCSLGVTDPSNCDIDAITRIDNGLILYSTDDQADCGQDPGDIWVSSNGGAGSTSLYADDVIDMKIASSETDPVDIDALSVIEDNDDLQLLIGDPYVPFYWKRGYPDYAPSGIPDFSQDHTNFPRVQVQPIPAPAVTTYCGPTAVADCFWWFDSKFEGGCPGGAPGDGVDDFPLVQRFPGFDDHEPGNAEPLIGSLANCMGTDVNQFGTFIDDMEICIDQWITAEGLDYGFVLNRIDGPTIEDIACEVERSENVILLLGFWWDNGGVFERCGGHYVTSAGVSLDRRAGADGLPGTAGADDDADGEVDEFDEMCPCSAAGGGLTVYGDDLCAIGINRIGISDPGLNNTEPGAIGNNAPGLIRGPFHTRHAPAIPPPPPEADHYNTRNAAHDVYDVVGSGTGGYSVGLAGYGTAGPAIPTPCGAVAQWCGQNPSEANQVMSACLPADPVFVEIESMVDLSPQNCRLCLDVQAGINAMFMHKGACPAPSSAFPNKDYIRGELCQLSEPSIVDLGEVTCLANDTGAEQFFDDTTPAFTLGIGAHFFLAREQPGPPCDYGASSAGNSRFASAGDCPCP